MKKILFGSVVVMSLSAFGQTIPAHVIIPDGWACQDKKTTDGKDYKVCSPPAGKTGTPFFLWTRQPKAK